MGALVCGWQGSHVLRSAPVAQRQKAEVHQAVGKGLEQRQRKGVLTQRHERHSIQQPVGSADRHHRRRERLRRRRRGKVRGVSGQQGGWVLLGLPCMHSGPKLCIPLWRPIRSSCRRPHRHRRLLWVRRCRRCARGGRRWRRQLERRQLQCFVERSAAAVVCGSISKGAARGLEDAVAGRSPGLDRGAWTLEVLGSAC
jgi:hypothetical protein